MHACHIPTCTHTLMRALNHLLCTALDTRCHCALIQDTFTDLNYRLSLDVRVIMK